MGDGNGGKLATRRRIVVGAGGVLATGLGCSSTDDGLGGASSPAADASGGSGGSNGARGVDASAVGDAASNEPRETGGAGTDATTSPTADAFSEAGITSVVDCHTHFFDPTRTIPSGRSVPVPWPDPGSVLYRRTLPPDYEALATPLGITG